MLGTRDLNQVVNVALIHMGLEEERGVERGRGGLKAVSCQALICIVMTLLAELDLAVHVHSNTRFTVKHKHTAGAGL